MKQQLTLEAKQAIQQELQKYVSRYSSQNKAANSLKGVSLGTINTVLNGKFENISDEMFARIATQISTPSEDGWQLCATGAYKDMETFLSDAQEYRNVSWIVGPAGIGKTTSANHYASHHRNVFVLPCSEDMHKADFVEELAARIGIRTEGLTVRSSLQAIIREIVRIERPLLVFDEADKLTDSVLYYFITIYNALEDKCGIVLLSTPYIQRRIAHGLRRNKKGYEELYSRICRRFVHLTEISEYEVNVICRQNGLTDERAISRVIKDSSDTGRDSRTEFDIRRVKKSVHTQLRIAYSSNNI